VTGWGRIGREGEQGGKSGREGAERVLGIGRESSGL
jgi:hypothetical protein